MPRGVYVRTAEHRQKMNLSGLALGRGKLSEETKRKIGLSHSGERSVEWKGDDAGYQAKHMWIRKQLGTPSECENCTLKSSNSRQFHWANISGEYKRDLSDWVRLCVSCHMLIDGVNLKAMR